MQINLNMGAAKWLVNCYTPRQKSNQAALWSPFLPSFADLPFKLSRWPQFKSCMQTIVSLVMEVAFYFLPWIWPRALALPHLARVHQPYVSGDSLAPWKPKWCVSAGPGPPRATPGHAANSSIASPEPPTMKEMTSLLELGEQRGTAQRQTLICPSKGLGRNNP